MALFVLQHTVGVSGGAEGLDAGREICHGVKSRASRRRQEGTVSRLRKSCSRARAAGLFENAFEIRYIGALV